jgi:type II secretory pathway pseudopilin PulG
MSKRKGFTLIEIMVVVGLIILLAAILIPVISHARVRAEVTAQNMDFQTISAALENYRHDFGDYPRNVVLPRWNTAITSPPTNPPIFYSLATALIGPGPGITQTLVASATVSYTVLGDGNDGPGFRTRAINVPVPGTVVGAGAMTTSVTIPTGYTFNFAPNLSSIDLSTGTVNEEVVGVANVNNVTVTASYVGPMTVTVNFTVATTKGHSVTPTDPDNCVLKTATGKVWDAYLPPDKFKVEYIDTAVDASNNLLHPGLVIFPPPPDLTINGDAAQPVLLDRWGQPIQYFTRFGPSNNRTSDSVDYGSPPTVNTAVIAGPLFGVSTPLSIDAKLGENAIWDWHDGVPVSLASGNLGGRLQTDTSAMTQWTPQAAGTPDLSLAFKWMLGDDPAAATQNVIESPETLTYTGPYILISAGPSSTWCDLSTASVPNQTSEEYLRAFTKSGNIYNFDR